MRTLRPVFTLVLVLGVIVSGTGFSAERERKETEEHKGPEIVGEITAKIHGKIEKLPSGGLIGAWVVKGKTINVSKETHIDEKQGKVAIGAYIEVEGNPKGNAIDAYEIEVEKEYILQGRIEKLPADGLIGTWIVSGKKVTVTKDTQIDDDERAKIAVGVNVDVEGENIGSSISADEIEVP